MDRDNRTQGDETIPTSETPRYSSIYMHRLCPTCFIIKPPKTSHCSHCDHCVKEFDHHCGTLNSCIGLRNFRSFVYFLWFVGSFSISGATLLYMYVMERIEQLQEEEREYFRTYWWAFILTFGMAACALVAGLFLRFILMSVNAMGGACFFLLLIYGFRNTAPLHEVFVVSVCSFLCLFSSMVIFGFFYYVYIASEESTRKEIVSTHREGLKMNKRVGLLRRVKNLLRFFFWRIIPKSELRRIYIQDILTEYERDVPFN